MPKFMSLSVQMLMTIDGNSLWHKPNDHNIHYYGWFIFEFQNWHYLLIDKLS